MKALVRQRQGSAPVPALMLQGTASDVGKSVLTAGLCRLFARRGMGVRPFKPQNMSNNAGVTADCGEIGRAQMLQARAAGVAPSVHMNPVLLKPESATGAQVVVRGKVWQSATARDYGRLKRDLKAPVLDSFRRIGEGADLVLVEGAGSPAEINLRADDIANMGFARAASVPVVLVADIDRGGVIANLVGTHAVLCSGDRAQVAGFLVNKFRGDPRLFDGGLAEIVTRTGWPSLGVVPWFEPAAQLPAEDTLGLRGGSGTGGLKVAVPRLPHMANFDDLDPLRLEPSVDLAIVPLCVPLPAETDLVVLPGSKSTIADVDTLKAAGWDVDLRAHVRRGGRVLGLCGGYQMLGRLISDPHGLEGPAGETAGLGLLDVTTTLLAPKTTVRVGGAATWPGTRDVPLSGYRIHMGRTEGPDRARPVAHLPEPDGAASLDGRVLGTYVHGLFAGDAARDAFLASFGLAACLAYEREVDATLDALADHLEASLDVAALLQIAQTRASANVA